MSSAAFLNPFHQTVARLLEAMDPDFLARAKCFFGGGTRIVMELGEYRESRDIDFLCADTEGYRLLRETVTETSLGGMLATPVKLAREVRADQYGIRTVLEAADGTRVKLEVVREARISLMTPPTVAHECISVPMLDRADAFAEKFLANADRALDPSTSSRDIIDLAFMVQGWSTEDALTGWSVAVSAYGTSVDRAVASATHKMLSDVAYRKRCFDVMQIGDAKACVTGVELLANGKWRTSSTLAAKSSRPR